MLEQNKPFVITDRRKFTKEGELRPDAPQNPESSFDPRPAASQPARPDAAPVPPRPEPVAARPTEAPPSPAPATAFDPAQEDALPAPTPEQAEQARIAYEQTADRLETALRAANPGADHPPAMNFDQLVQSLYLTAIMQLGGGTPEGEKPRVDILGARQSIDMLVVVGNRSQGNLTPGETSLIESALFELRMAFLEITQALARSAASQGPNPKGGPGPKGGAPAPRPGLIY